MGFYIFEKFSKCFKFAVRWVLLKLCDICQIHPQSKLMPIENKFVVQKAEELARKIRNKEIDLVDLVSAFEKILENNRNKSSSFNKNDLTWQESKLVCEVTNVLTPSKFIKDEPQPVLRNPFIGNGSFRTKGDKKTGGHCKRICLDAENVEVVNLMKKAKVIPSTATFVPDNMIWWDDNNIVIGRCRRTNEFNSYLGQSSTSFMTGLRTKELIPYVVRGTFGQRSPKFVPLKKRLPQTTINLTTAIQLRSKLKVLHVNSPRSLHQDNIVDANELWFIHKSDPRSELKAKAVDLIHEKLKDALHLIIDYMRQDLGMHADIPDSSATNKLARTGRTDSKQCIIWLICEIVKSFADLSQHKIEYLWPSLFKALSTAYSNTEHLQRLMEEVKYLKYEFLETLNEYAHLLCSQPCEQYIQSMMHGYLQKSNISPKTTRLNKPHTSTLSTTLSSVDEIPIGIQVLSRPYLVWIYHRTAVTMTLNENSGDYINTSAALYKKGKWEEPRTIITLHRLLCWDLQRDYYSY